jgi:hypothetical protein
MATTTGHTFDYDAAQVAVVSANLVQDDGVLSGLVSHNYQDQFMAPGTANMPIKVKYPTTLFARRRNIDDVTSAIQLDAIVESGTTFNLSKDMVYSAVPLSEADLNLNLTDFGKQVLRPQAKAISDDIEYQLEDTLLGLDKPADFTAKYSSAKPVTFLTALRKYLRDNGASQDGLQLVVGTGVYADLLEANLITDASQSGSTAALREAQIGRVRGFTAVEHNRLGDYEVLALHRDAVTLITRAPAIPAGASFGASVADSGVNIRYLRDYDATHTVDRSILATFAGVGILPTFKQIKDRTARTVSYQEVENGGVIHIEDVTATA